MSTTILPRSEIERIRDSLEDVPPNRSRDLKRETLKKLSDERQSHWPNTLEAQRKKREQSYVDKEAVAEEQRRVIDREEAERRRLERLESIKRANNLLYEQTDCMKVLRSKELLSDCIHDRGYQIKHKDKVKEDIKLENKGHHQNVLRAVQSAEEKERAKEAALQARIKAVAEVREEQLKEVRATRAAEAAEQRAIGEAMKRAAEQQVELERQQQLEKIILTKHKNLEFKKGNDQLKEIRTQLRLQEERDEARREAEVDVIENRKKIRKALEQRKFEKAQETRLKMIDRATKILAEKTSNDNALLDRQVNEQRQKEDKKFADKAAHREHEWNLTIESRNQQVEAHNRQLEIEREEERLMIERWRQQAAEAAAAERAKDDNRHHSTVRLKDMQLAQALERKKEKAEARIIDDERERLYRLQGDEEEARFREVCKQEIKRYAADGKPLYPLYRAMEYKQPDLLPVSGFRI